MATQWLILRFFCFVTRKGRSPGPILAKFDRDERGDIRYHSPTKFREDHSNFGIWGYLWYPKQGFYEMCRYLKRLFILKTCVKMLFLLVNKRRIYKQKFGHSNFRCSPSKTFRGQDKGLELLDQNKFGVQKW